MSEHESLVVAQFGARAGAYVTSAVHAGGADLERMAERLCARPGQRVLDLGCGGGHVAFTLAPHAAEVVACDLSPEMLSAVASEATRRSLANILTQQASAATLPFPDGVFDVVASRFSAHHWQDLPACLGEARRVAKTGALALFADEVAPSEPLLDTALQAIELLRDPSHVRAHSLAQWRSMLEAAGFAVEQVTTARLRLDFASWIARIATPELHAAAIRSLMVRMPACVRHHFTIEPDDTFTIDTALIEAMAV
jgi:ubiquinone/menaquinone biosynthesis C-methylase UbiE